MLAKIKDARVHYTVHNQHTHTKQTTTQKSNQSVMVGSGPERCSRTPTACQALKKPRPSLPKKQSQKSLNESLTVFLAVPKQKLLRKEVIQPHLPVRLPCYDFVPIANPTFDHSPQTVRPWASGVTNFRDVTGGVYKARERIHRSVADLRLLATPPSWCRVADTNPN